jgi:hypothetical protein
VQSEFVVGGLVGGDHSLPRYEIPPEEAVSVR